MLSKGKISTVIVIVLIIGVAGFMWYQSRAQKGKQIELASDIVSQEMDPENEADSVPESDGGEMMNEDQFQAELDDFNAKCENGEWIKINEISGNASSISGKMRKIYAGDDSSEKFPGYTYFIEGSDSVAIAGNNLDKLDYFEDRDVEVQGVVSQGNAKEIQAIQVKCAGKETDKNVQENRKKLMSYIQVNINSIAPQKAKYKKWVVDTVEFVDENNIYVNYYDVIYDEDEDFDEETGKQVLLETSPKGNGTYDTKVLAYWEMGEDDYTLKSGTDKFVETEDTILYQYDPEMNEWSRE